MRSLACAFASLFIALAGCASDHNDATASAAARRGDVEAGMTHIVPVADFHDVPLDAAIDKLRDMTRANIVVAWKSLESDGIERATPVTCNLTNVPLGQVLRMLAIQVVPSGDRPEPRADGGVIVFAMPSGFSYSSDIRVYDIRDLIEKDHALHHRWDDNIPENATGSSATTGSTGRWTGQQSIDDLQKLIFDTVAPDSWRDAGGSAASMRMFNGKLIINAPPDTQEQIAALLDKLRKGN